MEMKRAAPRCVFRGGAELAYGSHPSVAPHAVAVHQNVCADTVHGRFWLFKTCSASHYPGLRYSPFAVVLKADFCIIYDLTFARAGGIQALTTIPIYPPPPSACSVMYFGMCCSRVLFLRQLHGPTATIVFCLVDVKYA